MASRNCHVLFQYVSMLVVYFAIGVCLPRVLVLFGFYSGTVTCVCFIQQSSYYDLLCVVFALVFIFLGECFTEVSK